MQPCLPRREAEDAGSLEHRAAMHAVHAARASLAAVEQRLQSGQLRAALVGDVVGRAFAPMAALCASVGSPAAGDWPSSALNAAGQARPWQAQPAGPPLSAGRPAERSERDVVVERRPGERSDVLRRCGNCPACRSPDCGRCRECQDKAKFGGPGIRKKPCLARLCPYKSAVDHPSALSAPALAHPAQRAPAAAEGREAAHRDLPREVINREVMQEVLAPAASDSVETASPPPAETGDSQWLSAGVSSGERAPLSASRRSAARPPSPSPSSPGPLHSHARSGPASALPSALPIPDDPMRPCLPRSGPRVRLGADYQVDLPEWAPGSSADRGDERSGCPDVSRTRPGHVQDTSGTCACTCCP